MGSANLDVAISPSGSYSLSLDQMRDAVIGWHCGVEQGEVLRERKDAAVVRLQIALHGSFVAKLWARPGMRGALRRWSRTATQIREWRTLRTLHAAGAGVPEPLGYCHLPSAASPYTDALFMEDVGRCPTALEHIKALLARGDEKALAEFETAVIELTAYIVGQGIVDTDHSLVNTVVRDGVRPVRLDFEVARRVVFPRLAPRSYGLMLGRLVTSYVFAVQPQTERALRFAKRLAERLCPPARALRAGREFVLRKLDAQRCLTGIAIEVDLPW